MYAHDLFDQNPNQIIVTYPGQFQPWHHGHSDVLSKLKKRFGSDNVYVLTSNETSKLKSPFNFTDKYQLITATGVSGDKIIESNNLYKLPESFDAHRTIFITVIEEKDKERLNIDSYLKKDKKDKDGNVIKPAGSPSYFKSFDGPENKETADKHGYVVVVPEIKKTITLDENEHDVSHGKDCRKLWNLIRDDKDKKSQFLKQLYGRDDAEISRIFDKIAIEDVEADNVSSASPIHEEAAGVGVIAKNKKMAKDPRYSMSITNDVKPSTPKNMLRAFRLAENYSIDKDQMMDMLKDFLPIAMKELKITKLPPIVLQRSVETHEGQATFGRFVNEEEKIYLGINNRHPVDILRTLAHELTHFKQSLDNKMYHGAGETGSPIENEANVKAGIIMRHFNKKYPNAIKSKPLELDDDVDKLSEARRNPEQNPRVSVNDYINNALDKEKSYLDTGSDANMPIKNLFVSFTAQPKLGINPKSKYNTPLGIYAYPANFVALSAGSTRQMRDSLPFAGDSPWVNIFTLNDVSKVLVISNPEVNYEPYYEKLSSAFPKVFDHYDVEQWIKDSGPEALVNTPGGKFWYVTMMAARSLSEKMHSQKPPLFWNLLFRKLGIDAVVDDGSGIIHDNEQTQMVVFDPAAIKVIDRVQNKYSPDVRKDSERKKAEADKAVQEFKQISNNLEELLDFFNGSTYKKKMIKFVEPELRRVILSIYPKLLDYFPYATPADILAAASIDMEWLQYRSQYNLKNLTPKLLARIINGMKSRVNMQTFLRGILYYNTHNDTEYLSAILHKDPEMIKYMLDYFGATEIQPILFKIAYAEAKRRPLMFQSLIDFLESGPYLDMK